MVSHNILGTDSGSIANLNRKKLMNERVKQVVSTKLFQFHAALVNCFVVLFYSVFLDDICSVPCHGKAFHSVANLLANAFKAKSSHSTEKPATR